VSFLSYVCVSVSGVLFSVGVCVCVWPVDMFACTEPVVCMYDDTGKATPPIATRTQPITFVFFFFFVHFCVHSSNIEYARLV